MKYCFSKIIHLALMAMLVFSFNVYSAIEEITFSSPEEQARYQKLIDEMRCPKCLNANLSGSDAPIAADLRAEILEQVQTGRSNDEIIDFMTERYGDFVLYRPPLNIGTVVLWFGPGALLLAGFFILRRMMRKSGANDDTGILSAEESAKISSYLSSTDNPKK